MTKLKTDTIDEGVLYGTIKLGAQDVDVSLDLENDDAQALDFAELMAKTEKFAQYFTPEKQAEIEGLIAAQMAAENSTGNTDELCNRLIEDLNIDELYVFEDGFVISYFAPTEMENSDIIIQFHNDYSIDEIAVYDQND